jgi:hypothetical protein
MIKSISAAAVALALAAAACNDVGTCPATDSVVPGGSCSGESLECAYTLQTASPACDGTMVEGGIATSCVCTKGTWACPSAVSCPAPPGGGSPDAAGDDGGGQEAGGDDGGGQEAGAAEAGGD